MAAKRAKAAMTYGTTRNLLSDDEFDNDDFEYEEYMA